MLQIKRTLPYEIDNDHDQNQDGSITKKGAIVLFNMIENTISSLQYDTDTINHLN